MLRTVASPGTFGCHDRRFFHKCTEVTDKADTHYGLWFTPPHLPFVHQRGESATPPCTGRESRARSARSDRFYGGKARDPKSPPARALTT